MLKARRRDFRRADFAGGDYRRAGALVWYGCRAPWPAPPQQKPTGFNPVAPQFSGNATAGLISWGDYRRAGALGWYGCRAPWPAPPQQKPTGFNPVAPRPGGDASAGLISWEQAIFPPE